VCNALVEGHLMSETLVTVVVNEPSDDVDFALVQLHQIVLGLGREAIDKWQRYRQRRGGERSSGQCEHRLRYAGVSPSPPGWRGHLLHNVLFGEGLVVVGLVPPKVPTGTLNLEDLFLCTCRKCGEVKVERCIAPSVGGVARLDLFRELFDVLHAPTTSTPGIGDCEGSVAQESHRQNA
jgi:hypothetical protein